MKIFEDQKTTDSISSACNDYEVLRLKEESYKSKLLWQLYASELLKDILAAFDDTIANRDINKSATASNGTK
jgi:hypothetical protein